MDRSKLDDTAAWMPTRSSTLLSLKKSKIDSETVYDVDMLSYYHAAGLCHT